MTIEPDKPSGRSETLVQALEKIEQLEKQLKIAVEALKIYADKTNWDNHFTIEINNCEIEVITFIEGTDKDGEFYAEKAIQQIKGLDNKNKIFTYMGKPVDALTYIEKKIEYERKELEK